MLLSCSWFKSWGIWLVKFSYNRLAILIKLDLTLLINLCPFLNSQILNFLLINLIFMNLFLIIICNFSKNIQTAFNWLIFIFLLIPINFGFILYKIAFILFLLINWIDNMYVIIEVFVNWSVVYEANLIFLFILIN